MSSERELPNIENESFPGEQPINVPGVIGIDEYHNQEDLEDVSKAYLDKNPHILQHAIENGHDLFAQVTAHGRSILKGAGIAAGMAAIGAVGKVLYDHHKENQNQEK